MQALLGRWQQQLVLINGGQIFPWDQEWLMMENICKIIIESNTGALVSKAYKKFNSNLALYMSYRFNDRDWCARTIEAALGEKMDEDSYQSMRSLASYVKSVGEKTGANVFEGKLGLARIIESLASWMQGEAANLDQSAFEEIFKTKVIMPCEIVIAELAGWPQVPRTKTGLPEPSNQWIAIENVCKTIVRGDYLQEDVYGKL